MQTLPSTFAVNVAQGNATAMTGPIAAIHTRPVA
jgi:hypothetical protein